MASSSFPSSALEMPQVLKDRLTISLGILLQACFIHWRTRFREGAFFLPAGVKSKGPVINHERYYHRMLSLNGLFRHLSKGCNAVFKPPGITTTSIFYRHKSSLTVSVRWAQNESQASNDWSSAGPLGRHARIHSLTPRRNKKQN